MMLFFDIAADAARADLKREEERIKAEREANRARRLQAGAGLSIGDLLNKLAGTEEKPDEDVMTVKTQEAISAAQQSKGGFPAPPTSPTGKPGT